MVTSILSYWTLNKSSTVLCRSIRQYYYYGLQACHVHHIPVDNGKIHVPWQWETMRPFPSQLLLYNEDFTCRKLLPSTDEALQTLGGFVLRYTTLVFLKWIDRKYQFLGLRTTKTLKKV